MISDKVKVKAFDHAKKHAPKEACGLIVKDTKEELELFECKNVADSMREFEIDPNDYAKAEDSGEIVGIFHSHTMVGSKPSQADLVACEASGLPWYIVAVPSGAWNTIYPHGYKAPLIGREYSHGVLDCYALVRDWLIEDRIVTLPDFPRKWEWWLNGEDLYENNFESCGFEKVTDLKTGDIILMAIRSPVINHAAVYLGNNEMIHHAVNRLSCREVYGGFWAKNTRFVVRYRGTT
jgi:proteasome lid subunit RPN8/RPN11